MRLPVTIFKRQRIVKSILSLNEMPRKSTCGWILSPSASTATQAGPYSGYHTVVGSGQHHKIKMPHVKVTETKKEKWDIRKSRNIGIMAHIDAGCLGCALARVGGGGGGSIGRASGRERG